MKSWLNGYFHTKFTGKDFETVLASYCCWRMIKIKNLREPFILDKSLWSFRKNTDVWARWNSNSAYNIHRLQLKIAKRGVELLAPDGIMVYSTCSMNPAENEAVIAELLEFGKGTIELVDVSDQLPGLKRSPGMRINSYNYSILRQD